MQKYMSLICLHIKNFKFSYTYLQRSENDYKVGICILAVDGDI